MRWCRSRKPVTQSKEELESFYNCPDPWQYEGNPSDELRLAKLLSFIPRPLNYRKTLDIGCGNGFVTEHLPGDEVVGIDISENACNAATVRVCKREGGSRFHILQGDIWGLSDTDEVFDLIIITGVLYPQYIGKGFSVVSEIINNLMNPGSILISVHIDEQCPHRFPFNLLDLSYYPYREWTHRLEVYKK